MVTPRIIRSALIAACAVAKLQKDQTIMENERQTEAPWYVGVKLQLVQPEKWPFDIKIMDGDQEVLDWRRHAYGSDNKTLDGVMNGRSFKYNQREEVIALNARQLEYAELFAAAPETATERDQLRDKCERLREALKPFADYGQVMIRLAEKGGTRPKTGVVMGLQYGTPEEVDLTVENFADAIAALLATQSEAK